MTDEKEKKSTVQVARLDANSIYQGVDEIDPGELTDSHVHLPNGCDLPPGKHRWDVQQKTFVPLQQGEDVDKPDPHALRSIAIGLMAIHEQGMPLPEETLQWLDFYSSSMDFLGDFSEPTVAMIKRYRQSRKG